MNNTIIIEFKEVEINKLKYVIKRLFHESEILRRSASHKK